MKNRQKAIAVARANAKEALDQLVANPNAIADYEDNLRDTLAGMELTPVEIWWAEDTYRCLVTK